MSNVYTQEPPTSGKVILNTNHGDLEIELWTKETPRTCRNFIQLCLEGFYDNTVFHRIIRSFMVQGGDPTGTGQGMRSSGSPTYASLSSVCYRWRVDLWWAFLGRVSFEAEIYSPRNRRDGKPKSGER